MDLNVNATRRLERARIEQAKLISLAQQSLADDLVPLVAGGNFSDDTLDSAIWHVGGEDGKAVELDALIKDMRMRFEALGVRALLFAATEKYLADGVSEYIEPDR